MKFGINLYTLHKLIQTEEGLEKTFVCLAELGYSYVQFSGGQFDADMIARVSRNTNMPVVVTHVPMDRILNETEQLMEEHAKFGCNKIGLGMIQPSILFADSDGMMRKIDELERAAEIMDRGGFKFFYHNHFQEFYKLSDGRKIYDYMMAAPHFNFTFDTYWAQYGGMDVGALIEKLNGRIECVHLKDYKITYFEDGESRGFKPIYCPVGDGNMDFPTITAKMKKAGTEYFLVEQDNACSFDDPWEQVARSAEYLKTLKI